MSRFAFPALFGLAVLVGAALGDDPEFKAAPAPRPQPAPAPAHRPAPRPAPAPAPVRPPARPAAVKPPPVVRAASVVKPAPPRPAVVPPVRVASPQTPPRGVAPSKPVAGVPFGKPGGPNSPTRQLVQQTKPAPAVASVQKPLGAASTGVVRGVASQPRPNAQLGGGAGQLVTQSPGSTSAGGAGTTVPQSIQYDPSTGITLVQSSDGNGPAQSGDTYTVSYGRQMDGAGKTSELYGIYSTKAAADKAVAAIKAWADRIKKADADMGVARSDWDITTIGVERSGGKASDTGKPGAATALKPAVAYVAGKPRNIQLAPIGNGYYLRADAADAFRKMVAAARRAGVTLNVNSAFRSNDEQRALRDLYLFADGAPAARPGFSNHQGGVALDLQVGGFNSATYHWLQQNASRFGFTNTEGKRVNEAWHWVYQGTPI